MKLKSASVSLLRNLLPGGSLNNKEDLLKATRMYLFVKATYDKERFVCKNSYLKLDLVTEREYDYRKKELDIEKKM
jgi:hypothetical protein